MYILKQEQGEGLFYILEDKEYVVGRKNADIIISDDQSLSRRHAIINTKCNAITLTDCKSKYGTFHNNVRVPIDTDITLNSNDVIKFGVYQSIYRIEKFPIVTTGSGLTPEQKKDLKAKLTALGGSLLSTWDDSCTCLTATEIILTMKILLALIENKPIVTPEFWNVFITNVKASKPLPNVADFKPAVTEALLNKVDLTYNPIRKTLFKEKIFVFSNNITKKKMAALIEKTGGTSISWQRQELTLLEVTKSKNKYIFIYDVEEPEELPRSLKQLHKHVQKLGGRTIPVQEIAMAIVLCSCEKDCNPMFNRVGNVFDVPMASSESEMYCLAAETQPEDNQTKVTKKELIIPESVEADFDLFVTPKNPVSTSKASIVTSVSKPALKTEQKGIIDVPSTSKHTQNEGDETENNPSKRRRLENSTLTVQNGPSPTSSQNSDLLKLKKRSAEESLISAPKKMSLMSDHENRSQTWKKTENPFVLTKLNKSVSSPFGTPKVTAKADNPFAQVRRQSRKTMPIEIMPDTANTFNLEPTSYTNDYTPSKSNEIVWMSTSRIKNETLDESKIEVDLDPEFKEVLEKFKNKVIIETMDVSVFRASFEESMSTSFDSFNSDRKNFKKFRKVRPRRPQTIILATSFQQNGLETTILGADEKSYIKEEERPRSSKSKSQSRFNF